MLIILAVSLIVERVGGTALRLTGMPIDAPRFQSISALTDTGFTMQEAETTMHHPLRRKVLIALMFAEHTAQRHCPASRQLRRAEPWVDDHAYE
ncbi:hypothetical protein OAN307_c43160 [Octadecabacter antarcticus 307]|uniref:Uncharacterized protein n=1 Tax=Octadecabacter antarcticus 307 TaxID=391626 RepID=M9RIN9_9RHOB|nr:hypothetical protein OAN307_c43160 [Octadecabacter antarcticus 307]